MSNSQLTIKGLVIEALTRMSNGRDITVLDIAEHLHQNADITHLQIKRALRDIKFVKRSALGYYRICGRSVR